MYWVNECEYHQTNSRQMYAECEQLDGADTEVIVLHYCASMGCACVIVSWCAPFYNRNTVTTLAQNT